ncbi:MAG: Alpha-D-ribose 1-methylphosphonate 5-triphosphate synthase subunit PhnH [Syntrophaceae bacterium PtaU1.Bin231]|nr:MAG: Alpha-D-ribose 1-methylphosphonate 5-triphosphate synthase subunit PhnH [Syntrophaceae bacterium PtaU1.Bin231]
MRTSGDEITAQRVFRQLLLAMSRPGRICTLPAAPPALCQPWGALLLLLESLLDHEVGIAVVGGGEAEKLTARIMGRTQCRVADVGQADFVIVADGDSRGEVLRAKRGTLQYPDASATIVFQVRSLVSTGRAQSGAILKGPGIRDEILLGAIRGLAARELDWLREANADFPLGVDAVFVDDTGRILGIPRSTDIRMMER